MTLQISCRKEPLVDIALIPSEFSDFKPYECAHKTVGSAKKRSGNHPILNLTIFYSSAHDQIKTRHFQARFGVSQETIIEGKKKVRDFQLLQKLGDGVTGDVFMGVHIPTQMLVALKIFNKNPEYFRGFQKEERALRTMVNTPYTIKLIDAFVNEELQGVLVLPLLAPNIYTMFLCPSIPVPNRGLNFFNLRKMAYQWLVVLEHLRSIDVIHGDGKPENGTLDPATGYLTIYDFGLAILSGEASRQRLIQSPWYRAPEICLGGEFDASVDIWAAGCTFYETFVGWPLYYAKEDSEQIGVIALERGMPPDDLIENSPKGKMFFEKDPVTAKYRLKELANPAPLPEGMHACKLEACIMDKASCSYESIKEARNLVGLLSCMLRYENRITPAQALSHPFFKSHFLFELWVQPLVKHTNAPLIFSLFDAKGKTKRGDPFLLFQVGLSDLPDYTFQSCYRSRRNVYYYYLQDIYGNILREGTRKMRNGCTIFLGGNSVAFLPPKRAAYIPNFDSR